MTTNPKERSAQRRFRLRLLALTLILLGIPALTLLVLTASKSGLQGHSDMVLMGVALFGILLGRSRLFRTRNS